MVTNNFGLPPHGRRAERWFEVWKRAKFLATVAVSPVDKGGQREFTANRDYT